MSAIKKFVNNEWRIFSATDAVNISTIFPSYRTTVDSTYQPSTIYYWCYRSDKRITTDVDKMVAGIDYKVGEPVGRVYFPEKNDEGHTQYIPYNIPPENILVNSPSSVHDVLAKHDEDIALLKRNVSWLALHGGGGGGGGGGGFQPGGKAKCDIYVCDKASVGADGYVINKSGQPIKIALTNFNIETSKKWKVTVLCDSNLITTQMISYTNPIYTMPYSYIAPYVVNHRVPNFIVQASYEDDEASVYGYSEWKGNLVDATVSLQTESTVRINHDFRDQTTFSYNYSTGITYSESEGVKTPLEYTLTIRIESDSLDNPATFIKKFTIESGSGVFSTTFAKLLEDSSSNPVPYNDQKPGSYTLTATLSAEFESQIITSEEIESSVALISNTAVYVSKYLSTIREYPTAFSADSKLNIKYIVYKNNENTFNVSYYVVTLDDSGHEKKVISTLAENVTERIGELIAYSFPTTSWRTPYVGTNETLAVKTVVITGGAEKLIVYTYFKINTGVSNYVTLSQDGEINQFVDFRVDDYTTLQEDNDYIDLLPVPGWGNDHQPVKGKLYIPNKNNKTWIVDDPTTKQPSLRISNGVYAYLKDFYVGDKTEPQTFQQTIENQPDHNWTVSVCYRSDYHPDDNRTILSCGTYKEQTNELLTGFSINAHDIYIGSTLVAKLTDSTVNTVDITCMKTTTKPEKDQEAQDIYCVKVFVNGVLTAITTDSVTMGKIKLGPEIYIGGRKETHDTDDKFLCDCNIYSIRLFTSALSDLDILSTYINNKILTSYYLPEGETTPRIDPTVRETEQNKNLCVTVSETNRLSCDIYSQTGGYSISGFLDVDGYLSASKLDTGTAKALGIPIVLVDVSNTQTGWTFDNYHTVYGSSEESKLNTTTGKCQYWAPTSGSTLIEFNVDIAVQGTSSLEYPTKNIDITLANDDFFIPKAEWLPEQTYTIKVDMMDSAHSNNASIGKMINEVLGYDKDGNAQFFPASEKAKNAVYDTSRTVEGTHYDYHANQQPLATLKHTVEGFPIFLIMRFKTDEGGQTIPIGIGSFNLGRKALRNLGYKSLTYIKDTNGALAPNGKQTGVVYPFFVGGAKYHEVMVDGEWIETRTLHNNKGMSAIGINSSTMENGYPETYTTIDPKTGTETTERCVYDADFWQNDDAIIRNYSFNVEYQYSSKEGETKIMKNDFILFNQLIAMLPIEGMQYSQIKNTVKNVYLKGKYSKLKYVPESGSVIPDPTDPYINIELDQTKYDKDKFTFDYDKLYYYFTIAMLFGLVDNFGKNVSYRRWNDVSTSGSTDDKGKYYADFYDLDTSLGLSNTGKETVEPDVWLKYIDNTSENGTTYGYAKECFFEDNTKNSKTPSSSNNVVASFDNKLWLAIDSQFFRTIIGSENGSNYSYRWWQLRNYLDKYVKNYNEHNNTNYVNFVDFFVEEFFAKQTGTCGSLIFNYDYRLKYLMQFTPTDQTISDTYCVYIHGRRIDYVRQWLKNHVLFLDTVFHWRDSSKFGNDGLNFKNNIVSNVKFTVDGSQQEPYPLKTNSPIIMHSQVANNIDTFYWMKKNTKTYTNTIFNTNSPISVIYYNSPVIIEIGDKMTPLAYLKVNEIIYNSTADSLDNPGLPSLTALDFSSAFSFTSAISTRTFATGTISELRTVDFSSTKNSKITFDLDLNSSGKFTKLTDIDISSSCISQLYLPDTPLLTLKVTNSPINSFILKDQKYLKDISFEGCTNLQTIDIESCYSYDKVILDKAKNLKKVIIADCKNIKSIELTDCSKLDTVQISACPNLEVIKITNAKNLYNASGNGATGLTIGDVGSLCEINVSGCEKLTFIKIQNMTSGDKLRTLDISQTSVGYISGKVDGIDFETTISGSNLLDLSHFPNLGYNDNPPRKTDSAGKAIAEYFACYWNNSINHVKFVNDVNKPIRISKPFRSCDNLVRVYGNIVIVDNPPMATRSGSSTVGTFAGCSRFSIHGTSASTWKGKTIKNSASSPVKTSWELARSCYPMSSEDKKEDDYNALNYQKVFVATDSTNNGFVTNIRFGVISNAFNRIFYKTACTQFDVYYALMMIGMMPDNISSTTGSLYETFAGTPSKFNWASVKGSSNVLINNQPDAYTFFRLNSKISSIYNFVSTSYTYFKSPDVGYYHENSYDAATTYNAGDVVSYSGSLYHCLYSGTTGTWSPNKWVRIISFQAPNAYKVGDFVSYNSSIYICKNKKDSGVKWQNEDWLKIEPRDFYVAKDNGLFSPIPNVTIDRPFSGSAVHSKWLFRRLNGNYTMNSIWIHQRLITDIDSGRIYDDSGSLVSGYYNFMDPTKYTALNSWSGSILPFPNTDTLRVEKTKCTGNYDGFFKDFNNLKTIYGFNGYNINFNKFEIPLTVTTIGGGSGVGNVFSPTIARGYINLSKIFPAGNSLTTLYSVFNVNSYNDYYMDDGVYGVHGAQFEIHQDMFRTMTRLVHFGCTAENYTVHYNAFTGDGIHKYITAGTSPAEWDGIQEHIFDPIAPRIKTLGNVFSNLSEMNWSDGLPFPGKLFLKCKLLESVHNFMANCKQKYYLTSEGFANCPNLRSVYQMCYFNSDPSTAPSINSTLTGEIPYRFFYQGFTDDVSNVYGYGTPGSDDPIPATVRLTGGMNEFIKYTIKYASNVMIEGNHTINISKYGMWVDELPEYDTIVSGGISEYSTESTYEVGSIVTYKGKYYRCNIAVTSPSQWDSNKWKLVFESYISIINCCNTVIDGITYTGISASIKLIKSSSTDEFYNDATVTISTVEKVDDTYQPKTIIVHLNPDTEPITVPVEATCHKHSNDSVSMINKIINMYQCFYGCNNITSYQYKTPVSTLVSHTKNDPVTGAKLELDKPLKLKIVDNGTVIEKECGRLEVNPQYNPYKWIYNTNTDTWEENTDQLTKFKYCGYWSYNGDTRRILVEKDGSSHTIIADNRDVFNNNAFIERFDIIDVPNSAGYLKHNTPNDLAYFCAPDLFRYTNNSANTNIKNIFYNCGCYGATVARGMQGRICSYLLKPLSNITSIDGLIRNCRRLSSYKYGTNDWKATTDTIYGSDKEYYIDTDYIDLPSVITNGLPTVLIAGEHYVIGDSIGTVIKSKTTVESSSIKEGSSHIQTTDSVYQNGKEYYIFNDNWIKLVAGTNYVVGDPVGTLIQEKGTIPTEGIKNYVITYENNYVYQIPDTFFNYTLKIVSTVGTFAGLVFLYNTKLDIFEKLTASLKNICDVYATCHFITVESLDQWIVNSVFATIAASNASACFSLCYLDYNASLRYYVSEPTDQTVTCYYGGYLSHDDPNSNYSMPGNKLKFLNNFNGTRMGQSVKTAMFNWWGFPGSVEISENSGVNTSVETPV